MFEVVEGSTENMWYEITVKYRGEVIDHFLTPTMQEAKSQFQYAGYTPVISER